MKRLRAVPEGLENWRVSDNAMSFADVAQHLVDADNWLFDKLRNRDLEPIKGEAGAVTVASRDEYLLILDELGSLGDKRRELLRGSTDGFLSEPIHDGRFGEVSVWWVIVRGNLDHEIHHRGQLAAYLRVLADSGFSVKDQAAG